MRSSSSIGRTSLARSVTSACVHPEARTNSTSSPSGA
jgi:hypothetical protein